MASSWTERFGTIHAISKSHELIPTGIPTLDYIIGGYPCGSIVLILEDEFRIYSEIILKCFLAEGIANNDELFISSRDVDPSVIMNNLPPTIERKEDASERSLEELKIAWRYQNVGPMKSTPEGKKTICLSHDFDTNNKIPAEAIEKLGIYYWPGKEFSSSLTSLFNDTQNIVISNGFMLDAKREKLNVLRMTIHSFASPFWCFVKNELLYFLYKMRAIVHNSRTVLVISMSSQLHSQELMDRCIHLSDTTISLTSLSSASNPLYSEYNGLMKLVKLSSINSLSPQLPEDVDWAFKIKRKKIVIEKLHLPPEISDASSREQYGMTKPNCQFQF